MTVNECYGFLRKKRRASFYSGRSTSQDAAPGDIGSRRDFLNELLEGIPEETRYLLLLRELEGYSVAQLVETTGLNESTLRMKSLWTRQALAKFARSRP